MQLFTFKDLQDYIIQYPQSWEFFFIIWFATRLTLKYQYTRWEFLIERFNDINLIERYNISTKEEFFDKIKSICLEFWFKENNVINRSIHTKTFKPTRIKKF